MRQRVILEKKLLLTLLELKTAAWEEFSVAFFVKVQSIQLPSRQDQIIEIKVDTETSAYSQ